MYTKTAALAILIAYAEARFGQEQIPVAAIQGLGAFGEPGVAATLSGQVPAALLAGSNSCDKLSLADDLINELGNDPEVVAAAQALVHAEKNTNPFAVDIPNICSDATLPANEELRGIIPLIDPDTEGADIQNANADASLAAPLAADGLSVADLCIQEGFDNFNLESADGDVVAAGDGAAAAAEDEEEVEDEEEEEVEDEEEEEVEDEEEEEVEDEEEEDDEDVDVAADEEPAVDAEAAQLRCDQLLAEAADAAAADEDEDEDEEEEEEEEDVDAAAAGDGLTTSSIAGLDFGLCVPTMDFQPGRNGRDAEEFTFAPTDVMLIDLQSEALNPAIIINFLCDALVNFCDANEAAVDMCNDVQADFGEDLEFVAETAQDFNAALGFENVAFE